MHFWEWNVDTPLSTFVAAGGFIRWYTELNPPHQSPVFIFFERDAIARATATFEHAPSIIAETDLARLSPYLQFAVKMALAKGYNSNAPTKDARKADFDEQWQAALADVPVTPPQLEMLASVTGWPDPIAIRRGQKGGRPKERG